MPVLVLTPFIVVWFSSAGRRPAASIPARRIPEAILLLVVLVFAVWYVMVKKGGKWMTFSGRPMVPLPPPPGQ